MASLPSVDGWRCGRKLVMNLLLLSNWLFDNIHDNGAFWEERSSNIFFVSKQWYHNSIIPLREISIILHIIRQPKTISYYLTLLIQRVVLIDIFHLLLPLIQSGIRSCLSLQPASNSCFLALLCQNRCFLLHDVICPIFSPSLGKIC